MPYITTTGGLNFQYPTDGTTNYGQTLAATWAAISSHDHSGSGKGTPISASALSANSINDTVIRLRFGQYLRSLNNAGSGDVNLIGANSSDQIVFGATISSLVAATIQNSALTASQPVVADGSKNLTSQSYSSFKSSLSISTGDISGLGTAATHAATDFQPAGSYAASGANSDITALTGIGLSSWAPNYAGGGTISLSSISTIQAVYARVGPWIHFKLAFSFSISGTGTIITISCPTSAVSDGAFGTPGGNLFTLINSGTNAGLTGLWRTTDGVNFGLFVPSGANFGTGATVGYLDGKYRAV